MFAVAFVLFLFGSGCVRDARGQVYAAGSLEGPDYFACGGQDRNGTPALRLDGCTETKGSDGKHNINCTGESDKRGFANLTDCTSTGDPTVIYTGCSAVVIDSRGYNLTGPIDIFLSKCFGNRYLDEQNRCVSVNDNDHRPKNCTEVLSEYEKRKPAPTNNDNAATREDKKESPKQKQNDSPATRQQRSEVNVTEQNRPTSVERNESKEVTTPHTSTSSATVLLMGLHARVFCVLQLLRLLK
ncbi:hypothetical protein ERJ75_000853500 [Trypanosoma vivax]|nr:hypothetical protein ERJ75_000853500 [Trypanosoma vivax]